MGFEWTLSIRPIERFRQDMEQLLDFRSDLVSRRESDGRVRYELRSPEKQPGDWLDMILIFEPDGSIYILNNRSSREWDGLLELRSYLTDRRAEYILEPL